MYNSRREDRKTPGGFINDINESWANMPLSKIRAAIDVQRDILQEIHRAKGACTKYDTD